jgi:23S rRNA (adenine-C8)-methyltransferase
LLLAQIPIAPPVTISHLNWQRHTIVARFTPIELKIRVIFPETPEMTDSKYYRLINFLRLRQEPGYRYDQILEAIFRHRIASFDRMPVLPRQLRAALKAEFGESILEIVPTHESNSRQAQKILFQLGDKERVEAVRLAYKRDWESFCISSQCGCGLGCAFCGTGVIGLKRNLTADEITDQVLFFHICGHKLDSISFMGMGEPLANPEIFAALKILTDKRLFGLSHRRLTISTVGVVPAMACLRELFPQVNLVFSLHSPFNEQRSRLVPLNRNYPIEEVMSTLNEHVNQTRRQVSIAYTLLNGINDSSAHADALISLLKRQESWNSLYHINLIRYNAAPGLFEQFAGSNRATVDRFLRRIMDAGITATLRQSFGAEINSACGQLYGGYVRKLD